MPSNKTALTVIWIIVSIMAGELIIYKHQNFFSSYVINASDLDYGSRNVSASTASREKYDTSVNSTSRLYQNILARYASEENNKRSVGDKLNRIAASDSSNMPPVKSLKLNSRNESCVKNTAAVKNNTNVKKNARITMNSGRVVIHKVKSGETLAHISKKYFKTISKYKQIALQNNLKKPYSVRRGDKLIIVLR